MDQQYRLSADAQFAYQHSFQGNSAQLVHPYSATARLRSASYGNAPIPQFWSYQPWMIGHGRNRSLNGYGSFGGSGQPFPPKYMFPYDNSTETDGYSDSTVDLTTSAVTTSNNRSSVAGPSQAAEWAATGAIYQQNDNGQAYQSERAIEGAIPTDRVEEVEMNRVEQGFAPLPPQQHQKQQQQTSPAQEEQRQLHLQTPVAIMKRRVVPPMPVKAAVQPTGHEYDPSDENANDDEDAAPKGFGHKKSLLGTQSSFLTGLNPPKDGEEKSKKKNSIKNARAKEIAAAVAQRKWSGSGSVREDGEIPMAAVVKANRVSSDANNPDDVDEEYHVDDEEEDQEPVRKEYASPRNLPSFLLTPLHPASPKQADAPGAGDGNEEEDANGEDDDDDEDNVTFDTSDEHDPPITYVTKLSIGLNRTGSVSNVTQKYLSSHDLGVIAPPNTLVKDSRDAMLTLAIPEKEEDVNENDENCSTPLESCNFSDSSLFTLPIEETKNETESVVAAPPPPQPTPPTQPQQAQPTYNQAEQSVVALSPAFYNGAPSSAPRSLHSAGSRPMLQYVLQMDSCNSSDSDRDSSSSGSFSESASDEEAGISGSITHNVQPQPSNQRPSAANARYDRSRHLPERSLERSAQSDSDHYRRPYNQAQQYQQQQQHQHRRRRGDMQRWVRPQQRPAADPASATTGGSRSVTPTSATRDNNQQRQYTVRKEEQPNRASNMQGSTSRTPPRFYGREVYSHSSHSHDPRRNPAVHAQGEPRPTSHGGVSQQNTLASGAAPRPQPQTAPRNGETRPMRPRSHSTSSEQSEGRRSHDEHSSTSTSMGQNTISHRPPPIAIATSPCLPPPPQQQPVFAPQEDVQAAPAAAQPRSEEASPVADESKSLSHSFFGNWSIFPSYAAPNGNANTETDENNNRKYAHLNDVLRDVVTVNSRSDSSSSSSRDEESDDSGSYDDYSYSHDSDPASTSSDDNNNNSTSSPRMAFSMTMSRTLATMETQPQPKQSPATTRRISVDSVHHRIHNAGMHLRSSRARKAPVHPQRHRPQPQAHHGSQKPKPDSRREPVQRGRSGPNRTRRSHKRLPLLAAAMAVLSRPTSASARASQSTSVPQVPHSNSASRQNHGSRPTSAGTVMRANHARPPAIQVSEGPSGRSSRSGSTSHRASPQPISSRQASPRPTTSHQTPSRHTPSNQSPPRHTPSHQTPPRHRTSAPSSSHTSRSSSTGRRTPQPNTGGEAATITGGRTTTTGSNGRVGVNGWNTDVSTSRSSSDPRSREQQDMDRLLLHMTYEASRPPRPVVGVVVDENERSHSSSSMPGGMPVAVNTLPQTPPADVSYNHGDQQQPSYLPQPQQHQQYQYQQQEQQQQQQQQQEQHHYQQYQNQQYVNQQYQYQQQPPQPYNPAPPYYQEENNDAIDDASVAEESCSEEEYVHPQHHQQSRSDLLSMFDNYEAGDDVPSTFMSPEQNESTQYNEGAETVASDGEEDVDPYGFFHENNPGNVLSTYNVEDDDCSDEDEDAYDDTDYQDYIVTLQ